MEEGPAGAAVTAQGSVLAPELPVRDRHNVHLDCGHTVLFADPAPRTGDYVTCSRCGAGAKVTGRTKANTEDSSGPVSTPGHHHAP